MMHFEGKLPIKLPEFLTRPLSFSSISAFKQCPRKFKYKYIEQSKVVNRLNLSLEKGKQAHEQLAGENMARAKADKNVIVCSPIEQDKKTENTIASVLSESGGCLGKELQMIETKIMLDSYLNPTDDDTKAIILGFIDRATFKDGILEIVDYKTGFTAGKKSQLLLYALYLVPTLKPKTTFIRFIGLRKRIPNKITEWIIDKNDLDKEKDNLIETIEEIRNSNFRECPNWCCKYCEYSNRCLTVGKDTVDLR